MIPAFYCDNFPRGPSGRADGCLLMVSRFGFAYTGVFFSTRESIAFFLGDFVLAIHLVFARILGGIMRFVAGFRVSFSFRLIGFRLLLTHILGVA